LLAACEDICGSVSLRSAVIRIIFLPPNIPASLFPFRVFSTANQRTSVTNADGTYWIYQYDSLGQVTRGLKYFSDNSIVPGQQFDYTFDDIGNRKTAKTGGDENGANSGLLPTPSPPTV
jgi:YD repeat-containing protein